MACLPCFSAIGEGETPAPSPELGSRIEEKKAFENVPNVFKIYHLPSYVAFLGTLAMDVGKYYKHQPDHYQRQAVVSRKS